MLSAEDIAIRATGIGASEAWKVVLGESAHDVWLRLVHPELADNKPSVLMRRGSVLEGLAGDLYAERFGLPFADLERPLPTQRHPEHTCVLATPDAIAHWADFDALVEIKCPRSDYARDGTMTWGPDGSDHFPMRYRIQCTIQMAVTGLRRCDLVALIGHEESIRVYPVTWDGELADLIVTRLVAFWRDSVATRTPPPADGSTSAAELLAARYPRSIGETRSPDPRPVVLLSTGETIDGGDAELAKEIAHVRSLKRTLEERERLLVNVAKERTGELDGVEGCWTWKAPKSGNGTTSWKAVAQELGAPRDLIAKHTTPAARTFRLLGQED